jgi:hypothetical protein
MRHCGSGADARVEVAVKGQVRWPQNLHKRVTNLSKVGLSYWYMMPEVAA